MPLPDGLKHRAAVPADLPSIIKSLQSSPDDGSLWMYPDLLTDSDFLYTGYVKWMGSLFRDRSKMIRVAVLPSDNDSSDEREVVVGFSAWERRTVDGDKVSLVDWADPVDEKEIDQIIEEAINKFKAAHPDPKPGKRIDAHADALAKYRTVDPPSPHLTTASIGLNGMAVSRAYQGQGIGTLLLQWGQDFASTLSPKLPIYVTGEYTGISMYKARGFHILQDTQTWLAENGSAISRQDVEGGDERWKKDRGGCYAAEAVWVCPGEELTVRNVKYVG